MKKKILMTIGIIIFMITMIGAFLTISNGTTDWFIERDEEQGISWYYELVDGEAVNVRTTGGNARFLTKLVVPQTLGGYPVRSLRGIEDGRWAYTATGPGNILEGYRYYSAYENIYLKEIVLPEGLRELKDCCLDNMKVLEKINIPSTLEVIGWHALANETSLKELRFEHPNNEYLRIDIHAFEGCDIEKIVLDNMDTWNHIILGTTHKVEIGENIKHINGQIYCAEDADIQIPNTVQSFKTGSFMHVTDIWVDNEEENVQVENGKQPGDAWVHFKNKEKILTQLPEGIKAINTETNEEFTTLKVPTGSDFSFKLEQQEGYNYDKYTIIIEGYTKKLDKTVTKLDLRFGQEYTIQNITRDKKIYVETREDKLDLNLRQYIWGVNSVQLVHSRAPVVELQQDRKVQYKHTKQALYPKTGNKIRYGIRVYNEGLVDGTADKITEYIPEGLRFDETSEINLQYGWVKSADGRSATTEYLSDKEIKALTIYNDVDYKEVFIELVVEAEETEEFQRIVTVAEISEQNLADADSTPGNIVLPINNDFMQEESQTSNVNSYVQCVEDDMDFESISLSRKVIRPYSLTINKIDGADNQLLNGATFDLMDENKNVLKTGITANGGVIDFGDIYAYGDKRTRYYIKETNTPEGYKNHIQYVVRLDVVPPKDDLVQAEDLKFEIDMHNVDVDTSKYEEIEISTVEQLRAIENNQDKKYVLTQDIDLEGIDWEPLNVDEVMLDGKGHKIKNLTINKPSDTVKKIGLFATYSGIIENLTLENVDLKSTKELAMPEETLEEREFEDYLNNQLFGPETNENDIPAVGGIVAYSKNIILKNCSVSGNVATEFKNAGGLVGHSKEGTIAVFRNCTNEANVEVKNEYEFNQKSWQYNNGNRIETISVTSGTDGRNAGGMIGVTLGPVYVSNSKNTGNIYAGRYNAGGFIGTAEEKEFVLNNVFGQYNENLNIYVRNERINGNYNIKIRKVDETGNNLLAGAKFSVYDRNKQLLEGFENIELTDGILNLPEKIYSIGTDTFYIKETKAPSGYVKLSDTYIKVEIEKTWNRENQKYETTVNTKTLTPEEMQNDIPKSYNTSTVATGTNVSNTENQNVILKTNDVTIDENSKNEGTITTEYLNAGGFVGRATCSVEATDSENAGEVNAHIGNSAGIVAQIDIPEGRNAVLFLNNVKNEGEIKQQNNNPSYSAENIKYSAAGIVGTANSNIEIYNTVNNGTIESETNTAGILGSAFSDYLTIDNCTNNGLIKTTKNSNYNAAGILAQILQYHKFDDIYSSENEHSNCVISNCTNKADIEFVGNTGGIVCTSYAKKLEVKSCKCEEMQFIGTGNRYYYEGGIVGKSNNENLLIEDCILKNVEMENEVSEATGGMIGGYGFSSSQNPNSKLEIKGCKVIDSKLSANKEAGGIIAEIYYGKLITIENCKVENTMISADNDSSGGIIGSTYTGSDKGQIIINNCEVKDGNLVVKGGNYSPSTAGIITKAYYYNTEINKCNVNNTEIQNIAGVHDGNNTAGIIAFTFGCNVTIKDSNVKHSKLKSYSKIGGIAGLLGCSGGQATIDNCNFKSSTIEDFEGASPYTSGLMGGIVSYLSGKDNVVTNCSVDILTNEELEELGITDLEENKSIIKANKERCSGAICYIDGKSKIQNVIVKNTEIEGISNIPNNVYATFGGFTQYISDLANEVTIEDCQVVDSKVNIKGYQVSGFVGCSGAKVNLRRCVVNHSTIENSGEYNFDDYQATTAGIICCNSSTTTIDDCQVINNSKIKSTFGNVSGIAGYGSGTIQGCIFEDSILEKNSNGIERYGNITNVSGIANYFSTNTLQNCTVKNATLISNCDSLNGLIASEATNNFINCIVENLTFKIYNNIKIPESLGYYQKIINIGGVKALNRSDIVLENTTIKDIHVEKVDKEEPKDENKIRIGGLFGYSEGSITLNNNNNISNITIDMEKSNNVLEIGGLIGYNKPKSVYRNVDGTWKYVADNKEVVINGLNISNVNIKGGKHVGGIIGDGKKITITDSVISDINIDTPNSQSVVGGLIGRAQTDLIDDVEYPANVILKNIEINDFECKSNKTSAGAIGMLTATLENSLEDIELNNVKVVGKDNTGGIIGIIPNGNEKTYLKNITVNNLFVDCTETVGGANIGGLIGHAKKVDLDTLNVTDLKLIHGNSYNTGGLIGSLTESGSILKNITINASTGKTNEIIATPDNINNCSHVGILMGLGIGVTTSNINISNTSLNGGSNWHIGTIGLAENDSNITGINLDNVTITGDGTSFAVNIGGIAGLVKGSVSSCTIKNSSISSTDKEQNKIGQYYDIGGIVGIMSVSNSTTAKIDNCSVENTDITSEHGYVGGIVGFSSNKISNSTIKNSTVINTGETETSTGGILGHGSNVSGLDTNINNCKVIDTNITGNSKVGGISGGAVHSIENCYVGKDEEENIPEGQYAVTIKGKDSVGAIIGNAGELTDNNLFIIEMRENTVNNTLIIRNTTEGEEISNIDKMIGSHNTFKDEYTGTREEVLENNVIDEHSIVKNED